VEKKVAGGKEKNKKWRGWENLPKSAKGRRGKGRGPHSADTGKGKKIPVWATD